MNGRAPEIRIFNRQRAVVLDLAAQHGLARRAAVQCKKYPGPGEAVLGRLEAVEISIVSDRVIARVHRQFLGVPGATDVITFGHGEIIISATTAARQARENAENHDREVARYIVHGLLHLNGHEDGDREDAAAMWKAQEDVLQALWPARPQRPGIASKR